MSGSNDGGGSSNDGGWSSWTSRFLKVASAAAATAAVAGGLYAVLSSSSANSEHETPFGARPEREEREHGDPWSHKQVNNKEKWEKPEVGWVKVNVDGSREHNGPSAGCGGVVRDSSGNWVRGFAQKLNSSMAVHRTELEGILRGLKFVSGMKFKKVVVESDSESQVRKVEEGVKWNDPDYDVVRQIKEMLECSEWKVKLVVIDRMDNRVADKLANNGRNLPLGVLYEEYPHPPENCVQFLHRDAMGCVSSFYS